MTASEKLTLIEEALAKGQTVFLCTMTQATKLTQKNAAKFASLGHPIVKVAGNSLYVASGRKYLCADYCGIEVQ